MSVSIGSHLLVTQRLMETAILAPVKPDEWNGWLFPQAVLLLWELAIRALVTAMAGRPAHVGELLDD